MLCFHRLSLMPKGGPVKFRGLFLELIKLYKPHTYVELGVGTGETFNLISPLVKRAIAVDIKHLSSSFSTTSTSQEIAVDVKLLNCITLHPSVELMHMSTDEAAKQFQGKIDFLFIDACHEKDQVLKDFFNFSKFVKEGTGLIFLHDTCPMNRKLLSRRYCHNAWEAAFIIRSLYREFEIVTLPGPKAGLSIIRKSKGQLCINPP